MQFGHAVNEADLFNDEQKQCQKCQGNRTLFS